MRTLNWSGVAHIDLRYDEDDGKFKVIEVNTRFWGSLDASYTAGVNFPYLYVQTLLEEYFDQPKYNYIEFYSLNGLRTLFVKNIRKILHIGFLWDNTALRYIILDPFAFMVKISIWVNLRLFKLVKNN